jgi:hypothetical protein
MLDTSKFPTLFLTEAPVDKDGVPDSKAAHSEWDDGDSVSASTPEGDANTDDDAGGDDDTGNDTTDDDTGDDGTGGTHSNDDGVPDSDAAHSEWDDDGSGSAPPDEEDDEEEDEPDPQLTEKKFVLFNSFKDLHGHCSRLLDSMTQAVPEIAVPELRKAMNSLIFETEDVKSKLDIMITSDFTKKDYRKLLMTYSFLRASVASISKVVSALIDNVRSADETKK